MLNVSLKNIIPYLFVIGIFSGLFFEFASILICSVIIIAYYPKSKFLSLKINLGFLLIFVSSIIGMVINSYEMGMFIKQFIMLYLFFSCYYIIFEYYREDINDLFKIYYQIMTFLAVIGLIQFLIYFLVNIDIMFLKEHKSPRIFPRIIRISSIFKEPGFLAVALIPSLVGFMFDRKKLLGLNFYAFLLMLTALILTFSSAGIVVFLLALTIFLLKSAKLKQKIVAGFAILFITLFLYKSIEEIFSRTIRTVEHSLIGLNLNDVDELEKLNISSYALLSNLYVATISPSRFLGTGLGTHEQNYNLSYRSSFYEYGLNKKDAYSILIRIFSEFGYIGIILLFLFLIKYFNMKNPINIACLFTIIQYMIRGGHYTLYGTVFIFFLYFYSSKKYNVNLF